MLLSLNDILQPGASDHSVLYATAQLTEGRSARDQPKQPPAKKTRRHCRRVQIREEEHVTTVEFLGSQQDVSTCKIKKKQVDDATAIA